jgi:hypothetical protein
MSASTVSLLRINDTDANFRTWVSAVLTAIAAGGMVQTADTGQINPVTVTRPLAANTSQGYAIFRSDDAAGGLNNYYFKIEFGSGTATNTPAIWITVGWGSDGAGTLTGNTSTRSQLQPASSSSTPVNSNFGIGTGYMVLGLWTDSAAGSIFIILSIERTRTPAGAEQDEVFVYGGSGNPVINQTVPRTGTVSTNTTTTGAGWRVVPVATATYGANKGIGTLAPQKGGWLMESLNIFQVNDTDFPTNQQQHTLTAYGAVHTYITGGVSGTLALSASRVLLRYE